MHKSSSTTLSGNFAPNMFFSDEPGYYEDGNYGIRLETILRVIPAIEALTDNYGKYTGSPLLTRFFNITVF